MIYLTAAQIANVSGCQVSAVIRYMDIYRETAGLLLWNGEVPAAPFVDFLLQHSDNLARFIAAKLLDQP